MSSLQEILLQRATKVETRRALLLFNLQNDFLSAEGSIPVIDPSCVDKIPALVERFREFGDIVFICSHYKPQQDDAQMTDAEHYTITSPPMKEEYIIAQDGAPEPPSILELLGAMSCGESEPPLDRTLMSRVESGQLGVFEAEAYSDRFAQCSLATSTTYCIPGSRGAELVPSVASLVNGGNDIQIFKNYYSAFKSTDLLHALRSRLITELYIAGCSTDFCMFATALEAASHAIKITLVEDCLGYHSRYYHDMAIDQLRDLMDAEVMPSEKVLMSLESSRSSVDDQRPKQAKSNCKERKQTRSKPGKNTEIIESGSPNRRVQRSESGAWLLPNLLPKEVSEIAFEQLYREIPWQSMKHQTGEVPRLLCCQGSVDEEGSVPLYRHPSDQTLPTYPWTPIVDQIRRVAEQEIGHPLNHCLIQLYRSRADYISEHTDKTLDIAHNTNIVNVSFGAQRTMRFRTKRTRTSDGEVRVREGTEIPLPHNSMLVVPLATNAKYLHSIKANGRPPHECAPEELAFEERRISLTFRQIATFLDKDSRRIWGQGATGKTKENARLVINGDENESEKLLKAFGAENQTSVMDWYGIYGAGSDVLHLRSS